MRPVIEEAGIIQFPEEVSPCSGGNLHLHNDQGVVGQEF